MYNSTYMHVLLRFNIKLTLFTTCDLFKKLSAIFFCIIQINENIRRLSCIKKLKSRLVFKTNLEGIKMTNPISEIPKMKVLVYDCVI